MNGFSRYDVLYDGKNKATPEEEITLFLSNPMWKELDEYIKKECGAKPEISYNLYATQRRWNVEYHLDGRVLCTLFPDKNIFIAMIDIGIEEEKTVRDMLPECTDYVQKLFENTCCTPLGRWLTIEVSEKKVLRDTENLVKIRMAAPHPKSPPAQQVQQAPEISNSSPILPVPPAPAQ